MCVGFRGRLVPTFKRVERRTDEQMFLVKELEQFVLTGEEDALERRVR
jgi:hypothetical protein